MSDLDAFLDDVGRSQFGWRDSLVWTYDATRRLLADGIPGDLVECGVGAGCHPAVMARACIDAGETRTVRLFDSFEGIPMGGERDRDWNEHYGDGTGALVSSGVTVCSQADVLANLYRWFDVKDRWPEPLAGAPFSFHGGWFQDAALAWAASPSVAPIAFLRLDGDLYDSTLTCLRWLYPLVSNGGAVVVDDWNLDGCRRAVYDYFEMVGQPAPFVNKMYEPTPITESGDVWWRKP